MFSSFEVRVLLLGGNFNTSVLHPLTVYESCKRSECNKTNFQDIERKVKYKV